MLLLLLSDLNSHSFIRPQFYYSIFSPCEWHSFRPIYMAS